MDTRLRPLAAAAGIAVLIGAAAIAVVAKDRAARPVATPRTGGYSGGLHTLAPDPSPTPAPPPPPPAVPPPTGVDLIWRTVPGSDTMLQALDWTGHVRGTLRLPQPHAQGDSLTPSPDGQRIIEGSGNDAPIVTAQGAVVGTTPDSSDTWADDGRHLCGVTAHEDGPSGSSERVVFRAVGGPARTVTTMRWGTGNGGAALVACSVSRDLLVVSVSLGDDSAGHVVEIKVVRLSTGAVIRDVHPPAPDWSGNEPRATPGSLQMVTASTDGSLLALEPYTGDPVIADSPPVQIVDTVSGRVLGHAPGPVWGFSGDDALVSSQPGLVDWRTGRTVWAPRFGGGVVDVEPGGAGVVVTELPSATTPKPSGYTGSSVDQPPVYDYDLRRPDGSTTLLSCCGDVVF